MILAEDDTEKLGGYQEKYAATGGQDSIDTQDRSSYTPTVKKQCLINSINSIQERGWTPSGIPTPATLKQIGLWDFLTEEARAKIGTLAG